MRSIWPWKGDDMASFEKTLSSLSEKIKKASITRDSLRARSRRYKALWTLYTSLIYTIYSLILALVTGWRNWAAIEYGAVVGGPIIIYLVRTALASYYAYRLSHNETHLDELKQQRESAIEKFKKATNYNSTQQLLEKYEVKRGPSGVNGSPRQQQARTGIAPPPTANIRRPETSSTHQQPEPLYTPTSNRLQSMIPSAFPTSLRPSDTSAEFAPNAFSASPQYASGPFPHGQALAHESKWYDRMLDVLLGEDESRAANRLALICTHCRLVNGQAPPGVKGLEDVCKWRCSACGGWNGEDSEVTKIIEAAGNARVGTTGLEGVASKEGLRRRATEMKEKGKVNEIVDGSRDVESEDHDDADEDDSEVAFEHDEDKDGLYETPPAKSTRTRTARKKN